MSFTHPQRIRGFLAIAFALATVVFIAQPARADFTPPNTPKLTKSVEITAETGAVKGFYDEANGAIHVLGTNTLTTYDAVTLAVRTSSTLNILDGDTFWEYGNGFDPEHSIIFATTIHNGTSTLQGIQYFPGDPEDTSDDSYSNSDLNIPAYR
ncbi:MAG: hypothetical protein ACRDKE_12560, partial [Solirubrobacterales bacterium]